VNERQLSAACLRLPWRFRESRWSPGTGCSKWRAWSASGRCCGGRTQCRCGRGKTGRFAAIQLLAHGDDSRLRSRYGNPQRLSHDSETDENPPRVWTLKKLRRWSEKW